MRNSFPKHLEFSFILLKCASSSINTREMIGGSNMSALQACDILHPDSMPVGVDHGILLLAILVHMAILFWQSWCTWQQRLLLCHRHNTGNTGLHPTAQRYMIRLQQSYCWSHSCGAGFLPRHRGTHLVLIRCALKRRERGCCLWVHGALHRTQKVQKVQIRVGDGLGFCLFI